MPWNYTKFPLKFLNFSIKLHNFLSKIDIEIPQNSHRNFINFLMEFLEIYTEITHLPPKLHELFPGILQSPTDIPEIFYCNFLKFSLELHNFSPKFLLKLHKFFTEIPQNSRWNFINFPLEFLEIFTQISQHFPGIPQIFHWNFQKFSLKLLGFSTGKKIRLKHSPEITDEIFVIFPLNIF